MKHLLIPILFSAVLFAGCGTTPSEPIDPVEPSDPVIEEPDVTKLPDTDSKTAPNTIQLGASAKGIIAGQSRDFDYYRFSAQAGEKLRLVVTAPEGSTLDPYMKLYLADGLTLLEKSDDTMNTNNAAILFNADSTGDYLVEITSFKLVNAPAASDNLASNTYIFSLEQR